MSGRKARNAGMEIIPVEMPPRIWAVVIGGKWKFVNTRDYPEEPLEEDQQAAGASC